MIGWILATATRKPFHTPSRMDSPTPAAIATSTVPTLPGLPDPSMMVSVTAPEIAITAPTDRSMPRVAMTSVIPRATSISGALCRRMSIGAPYSSPSRSVTLMNRGRTAVFSTTSASRQAAGQNRRCFVSRVTPGSLGCRSP